MSFAIKDRVTGGLPFANGGYAYVNCHRLTSEAPPGYTTEGKAFFVVVLAPANKEGELLEQAPEAQWYSACDLDDFVPSDSKETEELTYGVNLMAVGAASGIPDGSKGAIWQDHLAEALGDPEHPAVVDDASAIDGHFFRVGRVPEPENWGALRKQGGSKRRRRRNEDEDEDQQKTILVLLEHYPDMEDTEQALDPEEAIAEALEARGESQDDAPRRKATKGRKKAAKSSKRAKPTKDEEEADEDDEPPKPRGRAAKGKKAKAAKGRAGSRKATATIPKRAKAKDDFDAEAKAADILDTLLEDETEIKKTSIKRKAKAELADLEDEETAEVLALLGDVEFLEGYCEENDYSYEDGVISTE